MDSQGDISIMCRFLIIQLHLAEKYRWRSHLKFRQVNHCFYSGTMFVISCGLLFSVKQNNNKKKHQMLQEIQYIVSTKASKYKILHCVRFI